MKKIAGLTLIITLSLSLLFISCRKETSITVFAGSASKPAMEEAAKAFTENTGIKVYLNFSGSGTMLSQMKLSNSGDLYIPGSPDYMTIAERDGIIDPASVRTISYLIPAILVQKGNPRNIKVLADLARPGIRIGIANPESVSIGSYTYEILEYNNQLPDVGRNIVTYGESFTKTTSLLAFKSVDAIIGWIVFSRWNQDTIDAVLLTPEQIPRISYITGAVSTFTANRANAQEFLDFLVSPEGKNIFSKWGYVTTVSEAKKFAPDAEIGGEYQLPENYKPLVN